LRATLYAAAGFSAKGSLAALGQAPGAPHGGPRLPIAGVRPRVLRVQSRKLVYGRQVRPLLVRRALEVGLCGVTRENDVRDAWRHFLRADDIVMIKFNQSGASTLGTTSPVADEIVGSLIRAGWPPKQLMPVEADGWNATGHGTRVPDLRWQGKEIDFGRSGKDSFLAALDEATAIINVPFLKTHHLATMTCCLKNLSHGLIRNPARFHEGGCDPAIAEIVNSPPIRTRIRLNIVNALRVMYDGGPEPKEKNIEGCGEIVFGMDPVACDSVAYGILNAARSLHNLGPLMAGARMPSQLRSASRLGLGVADQDFIDLISVDL
jgi:hypothetical protein